MVVVSVVARFIKRKLPGEVDVALAARPIVRHLVHAGAGRQGLGHVEQFVFPAVHA
jgi:hypothetical protein